MRKVFIHGILTAVFFCTLSGPPTLYAQGYSYPDSSVVCGVDVKPALLELAHQTFPAKYFPNLTVEIYRKNDIMCSGTEKMFNVVMLLKGISGGEADTYYGIYHVHFFADGKFGDAAVSTPWQPMVEGSYTALYNDWCGFIKSAYPTEAEAQGCMYQPGEHE